MKIAEALLLRKHLADKVKQLEPIKMQGDKGLFEMKQQRRNVNESTDEVIFQVPKVSFKEVTAEYDLYASELRKCDAAIQKANWQFDVEYNKHADIK